MLLATHLLAGALIGLKSNSITMAICLGLFSHIVLDLIPHWDTDLVEQIPSLKNKNRKFILSNNVLFSKKFIKAFAIKILPDPVIGFLLIYFVIQQNNFTKISFILHGATLSVLPDILPWIFLIFKIPGLDIYTKLHDQLHWHKKFNLVINNKPLWGLLFQFIFCLIFFWLSV